MKKQATIRMIKPLNRYYIIPFEIFCWHLASANYYGEDICLRCLGTFVVPLPFTEIL